MDAKEQAKQYYLEGMAIKDIADKLGKTAGTVRSWKSRGKWDGPPNEAVVAENATTENKPKKKAETQRNEKSATLQRNTATQHENVATLIVPEEAIEELADSDLTDKQKAFVIEYMKKFNATQAYMNVYRVDYNTAMTAASRLLRNDKVQSAIGELKKAKLNQIAITKEDLIADLVKEARADIGDVVDFGSYNRIATSGSGSNKEAVLDEDGNPVIWHESWVQVKDKSMVDTSLIKKISNGRNGLDIELHDRDKARKQLFEVIEEMDNANKQERVMIVNDFGGDDE